MKNLITSLILCIGLSVNAQLTSVTEGGNTGQRLLVSNAANHGDIGFNAVDLSYSNSSSITRGATGIISRAMGRNTTASGTVSTAMGENSTASGYASTAIGRATTASGDVSTAIGRFTTASDYASVVIGHYNSSGLSVTNSATSFNTANTAFVIGNGTSSSNRSDAFKVMFNGDAYVSNSLYLGGTEITSTAAELNLLSGVESLSTGILEPVTEDGNTGVRLSSSDDANHGYIGSNAVDLSHSNSSSSTRGATGNYSTAMGYRTTASGSSSTAMGAGTIASGGVSTAMGSYTTASGGASTAMGEGTEASRYASTAMGAYTTASGYSSTAMGRYTTASDFASLVVGQYNSSGSSVTNSGTFFNTANTAFVIGNGTDDSNRSDAFKVMFNGDATVSNDLTVNGDVTVSSDARLKANIVSLGATLSKLLNIDGKTYTVKKNGAQKIGLLAQDIQAVFPELVSKDNEGMLSVNYQGLIPVLINALKEQEEKIVKQQTEITRLQAQEKRIESQEERLQALERILFKEKK